VLHVYPTYGYALGLLAGDARIAVQTNRALVGLLRRRA
jgi:hypothetical protein